MKGIKRYIILLMAVATGAFSLCAAIDFATLSGKAKRFYDNKEWASAMAMYELMLQQQPGNIDILSKGIVVSGIMEQPQVQLTLLEKSETQGIPYDSIFSGVRGIAISLVRPDIYINFLELIKQKQGWLTRSINVRLLDFYTFRSNADNMISLATELLKATPENIKFMMALGDAYSLKGEYTESMRWYEKVVNLEPYNYHALLLLGNYYDMKVAQLLKNLNHNLTITIPTSTKLLKKGGSEEQKQIKETAQVALSYMERANKINSTPFLASHILHLQQLIRKIG